MNITLVTRRTSLAIAAIALCVSADAARANADLDATLKAEVEALKTELAALKNEVEQMRAVQTASAMATTTPTAATVAAAPVTSTPAAQTTASGSTAVAPNNGPGAGLGMPNPGIGIGGNTTLWGYGQIGYNRPTGNPADARADLTRAVIGFNHAFNETTRVYGELEWEHAVASSEDQGESEVEQLFVEHALADNYGMRAGLVLIPLGFLNEHHEPTQFYGVERNFVETAIIPSTWREGGVTGYGATDAGLSWNIGITTAPNLGNWDPTSDEGRASPLGSIHQELQLAHAHDLALFGSLNWNGIAGFNLGGGIFTGKIGQATSKQSGGDETFPADHAHLTLAEVHARWQPGPFDFSALYSRGTISDTGALNLAFLGQPTAVPKSFWGGYVQGAWRALEWGNASSLAPFVRHEMFNTGAAYAAQPDGLGTPALPTMRVWTIGANYTLNPNVVFKIDYQNFNIQDLALGYANRVNLGIGYQF
jgi:hypothetical protein